MARAALLALSLSLLAVPSVGAQESPIASDNIELLDVLPAPGVVGARFRGEVMYVTGVTGLSTYDVSDPRRPVPMANLPLPHFENEDVDLGGDILLISNDAAESAGLLYVIDIADPAAPSLLAAHDMGGNAATAQMFGGPGHTASCVLACTFAWVTDGAGIRVIDLRDPSDPVSVGTFATPAGGGIVTHDVQVDGDGLLWVAGFGGTAAYRLPDGYDGSGLGTLVARTNAQGQSTYIDTLGLGDGSAYNDFIHHNSLRPAGSDVVYITEEDYTRPGCRGAGSFQAWHLPLGPDGRPSGEELTPISQWTTELLADTGNAAAVCSAHYFDLRQNAIAQGWYEQGLRILDVSDPANIRQVGYWYTPQTATWAAYFPPTDPSGRVIYALDASHGIDVLEWDRPTQGPLAMPAPPAVDTPPPGNPSIAPPAIATGGAKGRATGCRGAPKGCRKPRTGKCRKAACKAGAGKRWSSARPHPVGLRSEAAPTVVAPILPGWRSGMPVGVADRRFGYACRLAVPVAVG